MTDRDVTDRDMTDRDMTEYVMPAAEVTVLMRALAIEQVEVTIGGGWAVDALLGQQTREHSDLDLWLEASALEGLFRVFTQHELDRIHPWPGDRPWNFVLHDGRTRRVDLHLYEIRADGSLQYGSALDPFLLPAESLSHRGIIDGLEVRCEQPTWAVEFHTGYAPRDSDRGDVRRLCERFGLELPAAYR